MNIFALSKDPREAAQQMIDKHIVKMPTESCQMLHTNSLYFLFWNCHGREPSLKELKEFHKESHYQYLMTLGCNINNKRSGFATSIPISILVQLNINIGI